MRAVKAIVAACLAVPLGSCGGGGGGSASPTPADGNTIRITISAAGALTPAELIVAPGSRVLFINGHNKRHDMVSDPHPAHDDCPEINQVGVLLAGQQRETGNLVTVRTCGIHDHEDAENPSLKGRIIIR